MERTGKNVYEIPERYKAKFKSGTVLNRAYEGMEIISKKKQIIKMTNTKKEKKSNEM